MLKKLVPASSHPLARLRRWQSRNPLERWRNDNNATLTELAAMLDVSIATVQQWIAGSRQPRASHQKRMSVRLRILPAQWRDWWGGKPRYDRTTGVKR